MKKLLFIPFLLYSFLSASQEKETMSKHSQFVKYKLEELQNFRAHKAQKRKEKRAKMTDSGTIPVVKLGFQSLVGFNHRILKPTSLYSYDKVNERNSIEKGSYFVSAEILFHYTLQKINWFELITGVGFESSEIKNNSKSHFFAINQGANFIIGKKTHKIIISTGCYFSLTKNPTSAPSYAYDDDDYTSYNTSPYFSFGYRHISKNKNTVSIQAFFKCQTKNHIGRNKYYESLPQDDPFLSEHDVPNYTTHPTENEYQWQTGLKLAYLFNLSK